MSDSFFSDLSEGFSSGIDAAAKLQNIRQSRDRFALQEHSIEQQQQLIDDQVGVNQMVGEQLANGKFDATALYRRYPRAYKTIQELQGQQAHLISAGASGPSSQIIQAIQSGDLQTADSILQSNAQVIDKALGRDGAHILLRQELRTDPQQVLQRAQKAYILAKGDPKASGLAKNTFNPAALEKTQKIDQNYSDQVDKLHAQVSATDTAAQALDSIIGNLEKAQKSGSLTDPALYRDATAHIPGFDARDLREALSPVMAQAYIGAIEQAKSSGASIRVTQNEVQVLAKGLGSLDLGQSDSQLKTNINNILTKFKVQRKKLQQDHARLSTKYQSAASKYKNFQQYSGSGSTLDQSLLGSTTGQTPASPAAGTASAAPAQPMVDQTVPQSQVQQMQTQAPTGQQAPQAEVDYLRNHPETADKFEAFYGYNPLK